MTTAFTGFSSETFIWFAGLERDNSRDYFHAHRGVYDEQVRGALQGLFAKLQEDFGGRLWLSRQHRDLRFSPDKTPYKTTTYGVLHDRPGRGAGGLYAELSADGLFAGGGYYQLAPDQLGRFRAAVAAEDTGPSLVTAVEALEATGVEVFGETLKTAPRGFPRDHPRIRLLRHKLVVAGRSLDPEAATDRSRALEHVQSAWRALEPIEAWLDTHVGASTIPPEERSRR